MDDKVIVEVKAAAADHPTDVRQVATYLRMTDLTLGYVLDLGRQRLRQGMRRMINTAHVDAGVVPVVSVVDDGPTGT